LALLKTSAAAQFLCQQLCRLLRSSQAARLPLQNSTRAFSTKPPQFCLRFFSLCANLNWRSSRTRSTSPFPDSKTPFSSVKSVMGKIIPK
jgi:hypothetical protein